MGRTFPESWQKARQTLRGCDEAYLSLERVFKICTQHKVDEEDAPLLLRICHRVGDLIYFEHDPTLRDIIVLKPDWLARAISFVLDDKYTREKARGLVKFSRLRSLWDDANRMKGERYLPKLYDKFLRLMERFDISYRVAQPHSEGKDPTSLIAQLIPSVHPKSIPHWESSPTVGDTEQIQICRIMDASKNIPVSAGPFGVTQTCCRSSPSSLLQRR